MSVKVTWIGRHIDRWHDGGSGGGLMKIKSYEEEAFGRDDWAGWASLER